MEGGSATSALELRLDEQEQRHREEITRLVAAVTRARNDLLDARRQIEIEKTDHSRTSQRLCLEKSKMRVS